MSFKISQGSRKSIFAVLISAVGTLSSLANATDVKLNEIKIPGQPYRLVMSDGREAVLKIWTIDSVPVSSSLKITDNTCTDQQGMACSYKFQIRRTFGDFVWTKNPDANRIGKAIVRGYMQDGNFKPSRSDGKGLDLDVLRTGGDLKHLTNSDRGLMTHEIRCQDFSWLPPSTNGQFSASRWEAETNAKNPETGLNENRSIGGYYGATFAKVSPDVLQFTGAQGRIGVLRNIDTIIVGSPISLTFSKADGSVCQTEMTTAGIGEVVSVYSGLEAKKPSYDQMTDYIYGSDNLLQDRNTLANLNNFVSTQYSGEFQ